jgi:type 1 fimbriae regulatory protein FimB
MQGKHEKQTVDSRGKDFLTEAEMKRFLEATRQGRHGGRDYLMMLMTYRHGLRVSELVDLRLKDLDLETGRLYVRRKKGSLSTHQPLEGDELRAIRAWLREREQRHDAQSPYLFLSERGPMTRQAVN